MNVREKNMILSPGWLVTAVITFVFGFSVLGYLAYRNHTDQPPVPREVRTAESGVLFTGDDIMGGQHLFQKYGLMQYGTLFGHGAYLGPDFTASTCAPAAKRPLFTTRSMACLRLTPRQRCAPSCRKTPTTRPLAPSSFLPPRQAPTAT